MKKNNIARIIALVIAILMVLGALSALFLNVFAASQKRIDLDEGIFAYGAGLDENNRNKVRKILKIDETIHNLKITGKDALKYIGEDNEDNQMISSLFARRNNKGKVSVEIVTPLIITDVTSVQYTNAAITAGLEDVNIRIASTEEVTGTSALTGVYKLMELAGEKIDTNRTKKANEEIATINVIANDHKDDKDFSKEKLNKVVVEAKEKLVEIKKSDGTVTAEKINTVIQNVIKDNNLQNSLNNVDVKNLQLIMGNFINIENLNLDTVGNQLKDLSKNIYKIAESELSNLKNYLNTDEGKQILSKLNNTFSKENIQKIFDSAKDTINSPEVEKLLNGVKENLTKENVNKFLENTSGVVKNLGNKIEENKGFLSNIFNAIVNLIKNIFNAIVNFIKSIFGILIK